MKRIIMLCAVAAVVVGCGGDKKTAENEFYGINNQMYYDANGEFDTLSYAMGMQIGMDAYVRQSYLNLDMDKALEVVKERIEQTEFDVESLRENQKNMEYFVMQRIQPYQMARMFAGTNADDSVLPSIYGGEFNVENVSRWYGYDVVSYLHRSMAPMNTYWFFEALEDSKQLTDMQSVDGVMRITMEQMQEAMQKYMMHDFIARNEELSREWLADIAQREGVEMAVCGEDTMYYRIEVPGNEELMPKFDRDSVTISYDVYTFRGFPIESTEERASRYRDAVDKLRQDTILSDSVRNVRIEQALVDAENAAAPSILVGNFAMKGAVEAVKKIGVDGEITVYMPAALAYGSRGRHVVAPGEAVLMRIKLHDVKPQKMVPMPGNSQIRTIPVPELTPVKKTPSLTPVE